MKYFTRTMKLHKAQFIVEEQGTILMKDLKVFDEFIDHIKKQFEESGTEVLKVKIVETKEVKVRIDKEELISKCMLFFEDPFDEEKEENENE